MTEPLLDAAFLARLEKLALRSRTRVGGARSGGHASRRRGQSLEFIDHREYVPGDDIRHLDWHLIGRLDRLFVKLFEAREDRTVQVLLDRSASMAGAKWTAARKAAAALAFASLCGLDRVQLLTAADTVQAEGRAVRGRGAVHRLLRFLGAQEPSGRTDLGAAASSLPAARGGALTVLITDGWDPDGIDAACARLRARGGEAHVLHVIDPRELSAEGLSGDLALVDAETGAELDVSIDRAARRQYRLAAESWLDGAAEQARRRGVGYFRLDAAEDVEERLLQWLREASAAPRGRA